MQMIAHLERPAIWESVYSIPRHLLNSLAWAVGRNRGLSCDIDEVIPSFQIGTALATIWSSTRSLATRKNPIQLQSPRQLILCNDCQHNIMTSYPIRSLGKSCAPFVCGRLETVHTRYCKRLHMRERCHESSNLNTIRPILISMWRYWLGRTPYGTLVRGICGAIKNNKKHSLEPTRR